MKIPNKLKIGGLEWQVEENEKVSNEGNCFGSTHYRKQRIFLEPEDTPLHKEQTLLHEILHAVWWQSGLNERYKEQKNIEEEIVSSTAPMLYQILKDNDLLK